MERDRKTNQDIGDEGEGERDWKPPWIRSKSSFCFLALRTMQPYGIALTYRRLSSRETGRANPKIILSITSASSLFVYCRVGYRVGRRNERRVRENSFYFILSCGHRSRRSVSILPSIEFNGVAHILLLSFVLPSSLLALLSHTMVSYPPFRQPD